MESSRRNGRRQEIMWVVARVAIALAAAYLLFTAAYFLSGGIFQVAAVSMSAYGRVMVTVATAFFLIAIGGAIFARSGALKRQQAWQSLLEAIRQIAQGNFQVRVDLGSIVRHEGLDHPVQQLVDSLNSMAEELAKLESMRQEFIGNVSHEIQSPLAAIGGFASILKQEGISSSQRTQYLDIICLESERLSRMTESLLKLTSLESGYHPVHEETFQGDRQIRAAVVALEPLWTEKNLSLEMVLPSFFLTGDRDLLSHVWVNCLSNAIKFISPGGTVKIDARGGDDEVEVTMTDTGVGIGADELPRVFERFYKADRSRTRATAGSGLAFEQFP